MNKKPSVVEIALALAGTLCDENIDKSYRVALLCSLRDTIQIAANAVSISSHEDKEGHWRDPLTPGDVLREMADAWDEQCGPELMDTMIQAFRNYEGNFQAKEFIKDLENVDTVADILNFPNKKGNDETLH